MWWQGQADCAFFSQDGLTPPGIQLRTEIGSPPGLPSGVILILGTQLFIPSRCQSIMMQINHATECFPSPSRPEDREERDRIVDTSVLFTVSLTKVCNNAIQLVSSDLLIDILVPVCFLSWDSKMKKEYIYFHTIYLRNPLSKHLKIHLYLIYCSTLQNCLPKPFETVSVL